MKEKIKELKLKRAFEKSIYKQVIAENASLLFQSLNKRLPYHSKISFALVVKKMNQTMLKDFAIDPDASIIVKRTNNGGYSYLTEVADNIYNQIISTPKKRVGRLSSKI